MKRIITLIITACLLLSVFATAALAAAPKQAERTDVNATITDVYDDRDAIISMTFDDGYYNVALTLQELFEEYDLYGSLMMISNRSIVDETAYQNGKLYASAAKWNELFDKGRLEPQNHSANHDRITGDENNSLPATEDRLKTEFSDSKEDLEGYFPEYDFLTYAIPYGNMVSEAYEYGSEIYYAMRTTMPGVQTLNPGYSMSYGSWNKMISPSMYRNGTEFETQWATIKSDIDAVVEQKGWYLPIVHKVGEYADDSTWTTELPLETAHTVFSYISNLNKEGLVWVTTYSNAVKYVRERQNSNVYAWEENGEMFVKVVMDQYTEDDKYLDPTVFNHPLTVKIEVPSTYGTVYYTTGGREYSSTAYFEDGKTYVKLNIVPDGSDVKVRLSNAHVFGEAVQNNDKSHIKTCTECGTPVEEGHKLELTKVITQVTCKSDGLEEYTCTECGYVTELVVTKNNNAHSFTAKTESVIYRKEEANCQHGTIYYYACEYCSLKGTTTYESGNPKDHNFGNKWDKMVPATETEDGYRERTCKNDGCDEVEREVLPKTGNDKTPGNSIPTGVIIGICAGVGGAVLVAGAVVAVVVISKKKKK